MVPPMVGENNRVKSVFWDEKDGIFVLGLVSVKVEKQTAYKSDTAFEFYLIGCEVPQTGVLKTKKAAKKNSQPPLLMMVSTYVRCPGQAPYHLPLSTLKKKSTIQMLIYTLLGWPRV